MKIFLLFTIFLAVNLIRAQEDELNEGKTIDKKTDSVHTRQDDKVNTIEKKTIDVFFPNDSTEVIGGSMLNVAWVTNYDSIDIDKLKLYLSSNNGHTWQECLDSKSKIRSRGRGYSYSFIVPDSFRSQLCAFRIIDSTDMKNPVEGRSKVFELKMPTSNTYGINFGFTFDFFDGVRISDLYTSAEIYLPKLLLPSYGVDFMLGRGTGHAEDSLDDKTPYNLNQNTIVLSTSSKNKLDVTNIFMSASLILGPFGYFNPILPHFEYRRAIKNSFTEYKRVMKVNGIDSIESYSGTQKKVVDEFLIGVGAQLRIFGFKNFKLNLSVTWDYSFGAKYVDPTRGNFFKSTDIILRFKLTEPQTDISFGGELKYPTIHTPNTPAELMFYFVKGFSLAKLYDVFFGLKK